MLKYDFFFSPLCNGYYHLTVQAPQIAKAAEPGHYVIIEEKFPQYVMGQSQGIEVIVSSETYLSLKDKKQLTLSSLQDPSLCDLLKAPFNLLMGENDALSAMVFYLKKFRSNFKGLVLLGTTSTFPFAPCPSRLLNPLLPADVIAALPLLEDWGVPSRLASELEIPGVFQGSVKALADIYFEQVDKDAIKVLVPNL